MFLLLDVSCAGADIKIKVSAERIEGRVFNHCVKVSIFDGSELKAVEVTNGKFSTVHGITSGNYGVVFFMREEFYPKAVLFKAVDEPLVLDVAFLQRIEGKEQGILTGVVYSSIAGGKIRENKGIVRIFKNERIDIKKDSDSYSITTDENGLFMIPLTKGKYAIMVGGKDAGEIVVEAGRATIRNLQKGFVLMD